MNTFKKVQTDEALSEKECSKSLWHAPTVTKIDLKMTMSGSAPNLDGFGGQTA